MLKFKKLLSIGYLLILLTFVFQGGLFAQEAKYEQQSVDGLVCMEAENYTELVILDTTYWAFVTTPDTFSGTGGMQAGPPGVTQHKTQTYAQTWAPYMEYPVNFVSADTVYVWARASHTDGYDDSVWIGIDGNIYGNTQPLTFKTAQQPLANVWVWINIYQGDEVNPAKLPISSTGLHRFNIFMREQNFKIDKMLLTTNPEYTPTGMGPEETLVTSIDASAAPAPLAFELLQNYPNPFNPSTTISYTLGQTGPVNLRIYDLLGKEVAVLVNEFQAAGNHQVQWTAEGLASGIYLYQLTSGTYSETRKLLLQK
jgi:hypothetical protein